MQRLALWPQGHTRGGPFSASILIWLAGFPTDFLVVGSHVCCGFVFLRRGFPTDFPVVGWAWVSQHFGNSRGFPADFPVVGCERRNTWNPSDLRLMDQAEIRGEPAGAAPFFH